MPPSPEGLHSYLTKNYPDGEYYSVYEAGFCGFWIHDKLVSLGINNIVVNPGDIPTTNAEKLKKTDAVDSAKMARSLREGSLSPIYTPKRQDLELRTLIRMKDMLTKDSTRAKNRIKSFLRFLGFEIPEQFLGYACWSHRFIIWLESISTTTEFGKQALDLLIDDYQYIRKQRLALLRNVRKIVKDEKYYSQMVLLRSVPGLGELTALALLSEIIDINRFKNANSLADYVGFVPMCHRSSIDDTSSGDITIRKHNHLRWQLTQVSWKAIKDDPALTIYFENCCQRMPKNRAIIKVARKLINRIYHVLKYQTKYVRSTTETSLSKKESDKDEE